MIHHRSSAWTAALLLLGAHAASAAPPPALQVAFGEEKASWLTSQLERFQGSGTLAARGLPVSAAGLAEGLASGRLKPDVYCATSTAELHQVNHAWLESGQKRPLLGAGLPVARSPLVWAMPAPVARALGWPQKRFSWQDFLQWSSEPGRWKSRGYPEWEPFRFAHVNPQHGAAGLLAVSAELRAVARRELSSAVLGSARVQEAFEQVERANHFYGDSSGFHLRGLGEHGPRFVSLAYAFENQVVEHTLSAGGAPSLVAVYPAEGAPAADHPCAILDAPWVDPARRAAAERFITQLRSPEAQREALQRGLRPVDGHAPLTAPLDAAHGVEPSLAGQAWSVPERETLATVLSVWRARKRSYSAVLALDRSRHMAGEPLERARKTVRALLGHLNRVPGELSFFFYAAEPHETVPPPPGSQPRLGPSHVQDGFEMPGLREYPLFDKLPARGPATLRDAVMDSQSFANGRMAGYLMAVGANPHRTSFGLIFTSGVDDGSAFSLEQLLRFLRYEPVDVPPGPVAPSPPPHWPLSGGTGAGSPGGGEPRYQLTVPIFLVVYGERADWATLGRIATAAGGAVIDARGQPPEAVARRLASFF